MLSFSVFGFYLVICTLKDRRQRRFEKKYGLKKKEWWLWVNRLITFVLVMIARVFFRANTICDSFSALTKMVLDVMKNPMIDVVTMLYGFTSIFVVFVAEYTIEYKKIVVTKKNYLRVYSLCGIGLLSAILLLGVFDGGQFIYFQF